MSTILVSAVRRRRIPMALGFCALLGVVVLVLAWGHGAPTGVSAEGEGEPVDFKLRIDDCIGGPVDTGAGDATCDIGLGETFTVAVDLVTFGTTPGAADPYDGFDASLTYSGVTSQDNGSFTWPDCVFGAFSYPPGPPRGVLGGCGIGISDPSSTYVGELLRNDFTCTEEHTLGNTIVLVPGDGNTALNDGSDYHWEKGTETLTVNCVPEPTATPTPTPPPVPRVQKLPALSNLFLVAQENGKLPPAICEEGVSVATLTETLSQEIVSTGKDPTETQQLAAFQFEVGFDPALVCVEVAPADGEGEAAENMTCTTETTEGLVLVDCSIVEQTDLETGEDITQYPDTSTQEGRTLARLEVRAQPALYSQFIPSQGNNVAAQILDEECQLTDQDGNEIPIWSCEDAHVTIRYLEADIVADCVVDAVDLQAMAFRWGEPKACLDHWWGCKPHRRFDLHPPPKGDGYISIGDLQFVFGRHNSTCSDPNPPQPPFNPKEP